MNRDELTRRVDEGWADLEAAFEGLDEDALTTPRDPGGWTIRDHLAHIAAWERIVTYRLRGRADEVHEAVGLTREESDALDQDGLNAHIQETSREQPMGKVLIDLREAHREFQQALEEVSEEALSRPWLPDEPDRGALAENVVGNTFEHYEEHLPAIRSLAGREGPG
ncbi:MAG: ClbS/DfsB family four-helix bundle protein [Actinobacteria bacterium]|nr:ClbS/DfsB family four-helix bundle protein [Actinomycetota bacterium]